MGLNPTIRILHKYINNGFFFFFQSTLGYCVCGVYNYGLLWFQIYQLRCISNIPYFAFFVTRRRWYGYWLSYRITLIVFFLLLLPLLFLFIFLFILDKKKGKGFCCQRKKNVHSASHIHILDFLREKERENCGCRSQLEDRGGKINPNPFTHLNPPTLIEPKPTQLLVGLNGHQPKQTK